ncbi:MAG: hypothetical protein HQ513_12530 [Rhodospirillales bacterium]|nr:hypothetical protein [Rhodospirillales bacterium]
MAASELNGKKTLLLGNNDRLGEDAYVAALGNATLRYKSVPLAEGGKVELTHYPLHPGELEGFTRLNIHGHRHGKVVLEPDGRTLDRRYINVSADALNFEPVRLTDVLRRTEYTLASPAHSCIQPERLVRCAA